MTTPIPSPRPRVGVLALIAAAVVLGSGCATTPGYSEDIGVRRVGLSLAFKDEALAKPVEPKVIIQFIPAPPSLVTATPEAIEAFETPTVRRPVSPVSPPRRLCDKAEEGAAPDRPAPFAIAKPPLAGKYRRINSGTIKIMAGALSLQVPYPLVTVMEVKNVTATTTPSPAPGVPPTPLVTYDIVETLAPGFVITESFQFNDAQLDLVQRKVENANGTSVVTPMPPAKIYDFAGIGTQLVAVGADLENVKGFALQGEVSGTKVNDLCGTVIDSVRTTTRTTVVNLANPTQTSGTQAGATDTTDVATQLGGLFARREFHTTEITSQDGTPVTITYDVVSTLGQVTPGGF